MSELVMVPGTSESTYFWNSGLLNERREGLLHEEGASDDPLRHEPAANVQRQSGAGGGLHVETYGGLSPRQRLVDTGIHEQRGQSFPSVFWHHE